MNDAVALDPQKPSSAPTAGVIEPIASSALLDEAVPATEVSARSGATTAVLADGSLCVLYRGAGGRLHLVRRSAQSSTGWILETLPATPAAITQHRVALDTGGRLVVVATSGRADGFWTIARGRKNGDGWDTSWTTLPLPRGVSGSTVVYGVEIAPAREPSLHEIWWWSYDGATGQVGEYVYRDEDGAWQWSQQVVTANVGPGGSTRNDDPTPITLVDTPSLGRGIVFNGWQFLQFDGQILFPLEQFAKGYVAVAQATQANGAPAIFLQDDFEPETKGYSTVVRYIDGEGIRNEGQPLERELGAVPAESLAACSATTGHPITLLVAAGGMLYVWQPGQSSGGTDGELVNLGIVADALAATSFASTTTEFIAVRGNALVHVWQTSLDAPDEPGAWHAEDIELPTTNEVVARAAHSTTLRLTNQSGRPLGRAKVSLRSDERCEVRIGKKVYALGGERSCTVETDASGRIRFSMPADRCSAPVLSVSAVTLDAAGGSRAGLWDIHPSATVLKRMAHADAATIQGLITDASQVSTVEKVLRDSWETASKADLRLVEARGARSSEPRLGDAGRGWHLRRKGGATELAPISAESFAARWAAAENAPRTSVMGLFYDALETLENAATDAAKELYYDFKFDTVTGALGVVFELVVDGVSRVFRFVTGVADEFLDVLEVVWLAVGATLEALMQAFGWLVSKMRASVWRTYGHIKGRLDGAADRLPKVFYNLASEITTSIEALRKTLEDPDLKGSDAIAGTDLEVRSEDDDFTSARALLGEHASPLSSVLDAVLSLGVSGGFDGTIPAEVTTELTTAFQSLTSAIITSVEQRAKPLLAYVQQKAEAGTEALKDTTIRELFLTLAKGSASAILGLLEDVLRDVLYALADVIAIVEKDLLRLDLGKGLLYYLLNLWSTSDAAEPATVNAIVSLLLAVPATILCKLFYDEELFPEDARAATDAKWPLFVTGSALATVGALSDMALDDAATTGVPWWVNLVFANALPIALQCLSGPYASEGAVPREGADGADWAAWAAGWLPVAYNLWVGAQSTLTRNGRSAEEVPGLTTAGILQLLVALSATCNKAEEHDTTAWDWVGLFGAVPGCCKGLAQDPETLPALLVVDVVGYGCGALANAYSFSAD